MDQSWGFMAKSEGFRVQYLAGEDPPGYATWTRDLRKALTFSTPHDAWVWASTRMSPDSVVMIPL